MLAALCPSPGLTVWASLQCDTWCTVSYMAVMKCVVCSLSLKSFVFPSTWNSCFAVVHFSHAKPVLYTEPQPPFTFLVTILLSSCPLTPVFHLSKMSWTHLSLIFVNLGQWFFFFFYGMETVIFTVNLVMLEREIKASLPLWTAKNNFRRELFF